MWNSLKRQVRRGNERDKEIVEIPRRKFAVANINITPQF
jgi:hypothetical protein